jgi:hypothetical protein
MLVDTRVCVCCYNELRSSYKNETKLKKKTLLCVHITFQQDEHDMAAPLQKEVQHWLELGLSALDLVASLVLTFSFHFSRS